jgi:uncharacterized protein (DUF2336 family)
LLTERDTRTSHARPDAYRMYQQRSLISELEDAVRRGSSEKRVTTLRRITDLFLGDKEKLNEDQIQVFDEVLSHLIARMEATFLIELSERLAPVNNAPIKVVNTLARDDEIAIAGPILSLSDRLTTPDLIEIAQAKSQAHLLAISNRTSLSEALTDILIERGDRDVIAKVAENGGARLSDKSYASLVDRPEADETLLEKLGLRLDIPLHIFRRLLQRASQALRGRLLASAPPEKRDEIQEILASIPNEVIADEEADYNFAAAERIVLPMHERGQLDQVALLGFAKARKFAATLTALGALCSTPVDIIKKILSDGRSEPLLVVCKAAELSWPTLRALLQGDLLGKPTLDEELQKLKSDYNRLSHATAKKLLDFWREQQSSQNVV